MKNLLKPKWILIFNSLPILLVLLIFWWEYSLLESILAPDNKKYWLYAGVGLAVLGMLHLGYSLWLSAKKQEANIPFAAVSISSMIGYLYIFNYHYDKIVPFEVPRWMLQDSPLLLIGSFLMPAMVYPILVAIVQTDAQEKKNVPGLDFAISLFLPVCCFLFAQIVMPLWRLNDERILHVVLVIFITLIVIAIFFFLRGIYVTLVKNSGKWEDYEIMTRVIFSVVLPLIGLSFSLKLGEGSLSTPFGDFSNPWFFILALLNGVLVCLPDWKNVRYRGLLFLGRCAGFAYTLYFFLVFLPYIPLGMIMLLVMGMGTLILTPTVLFMMHLHQLHRDYVFLKESGASSFLGFAALLSFLLLPMAMTALFLRDKIALNEALDHAYHQNFKENKSINRYAMNRILRSVESHKSNGRRNFIFEQSGTPFISTYYNWLVLDNLTLSNSKIGHLKQIFFGSSETDEIKYLSQRSNFRTENIKDASVRIDSFHVASHYDSAKGFWISAVDLEIYHNSTLINAEFSSVFELPVGCWISDYYLYVGDRKEKGILAEKKAAMWIYSQIRNTNRDPGLIHYLDGRKVLFKVFPFAAREKRRTGIEFIHKEPLSLEIDNRVIFLGDSSALHDKTVSSSHDGQVIYVPSAVKKELPKVQRKPYYHFIVDVSGNGDNKVNTYTQQIEAFLEANKTDISTTKISLVNAYIHTLKDNKNWQKAINNANYKGGFFLERAIETILFEACSKAESSYPRMIVLSKHPDLAVLSKYFEDYKDCYLEEQQFYFLGKHPDSLQTSELYQQPYIRDTVTVPNSAVLAYPNATAPIAYLADDGKASLVLKKDLIDLNDSKLPSKDWYSGLALQGYYFSSQVLHPETSEKTWLRVVRASFQSNLLSPMTSFIALENEAQKKMLLRKQEQVLSGNKSLDIPNDADRMSAPSVWWYLLLFGVFLLLRRRPWALFIKK